MNEILGKLSNIQQAIKVPKELHNNFGGFDYRSAEIIIEKVKPELKKENCILLLSDKIKDIGGWKYVEATATLIDIESGDEIISKASARESEIKKGMDSSQITGAASSYARKYAMSGLFALDDGKDADDMDNRKKTQPKPIVAKTLADKKMDLLQKFKSKGINNIDNQRNLIKSAIGKETIDTEEELKKVIEELGF